MSGESDGQAPELERLLVTLMELGKPDRLDTDVHLWLDRAASLRDVADDLGSREGAQRVLAWAEALERGGALAGAQQARLEYLKANAWSTLQSVQRSDAAEAWSWEQPEIVQQIVCLRRAQQHPAFCEMPLTEQSRAWTNLGNALSTVGRVIDALPAWRAAYAADNRAFMAVGNEGYGLWYYAMNVFDPGHRVVLLRRAEERLDAALKLVRPNHPDATSAVLDGMAKTLADVQSALATLARKTHFELEDYPYGSTPDEQSYRKWCLRYRLFLNPLNDAETSSIAARDVLMLPDHVLGPRGTSFVALYNQIKQEYASARWLLYEGVERGPVHFSDVDVWLSQVYDHAVYGLAVEKVKLAFRSAYSLLDKIGFFVNAYWEVGIPEKKVSFRNVWYQAGDNKGDQVGSKFAGNKNLMLRGLFWLSKDFFDDTLKASTEPDAAQLNEIRNHLEHKCLKVVDNIAAAAVDLPPQLADPLSTKIQRGDFEAKALKLMSLARSALIYTSLAVHKEELIRAGSRSEPMGKIGGEVLPDGSKR